MYFYDFSVLPKVVQSDFFKLHCLLFFFKPYLENRKCSYIPQGVSITNIVDFSLSCAVNSILKINSHQEKASHFSRISGQAGIQFVFWDSENKFRHLLLSAGKQSAFSCDDVCLIYPFAFAYCPNTFLYGTEYIYHYIYMYLLSCLLWAESTSPANS